jgi:riboflavin kinase/FMN adenylyltransferase
MTVRVHSIEDVAVHDALLTIGTFDGVHLGHQLLISSAAARARELGVPFGIVTFEPIPASVLRPEQFIGRLCPPEDKLRLLGSFQPDLLLVIKFNLELAGQTPEEFMSSLSQATSLRELWIGEAFALGKGRSGGVERLTEIGHDLGYSVTAVQREEDIDGVISSSRIRHAVQLGDISLANRLLGRPFRIRGEVVQGAQFGRTIGYPTANVFPPVDLVALADGIYASKVILAGEDQQRLSMTYVGTRPSVNTGARQIETHVLDYSGDLYGQEICVDVMQRLRPDAYFPSVDALVAQLRIDEEHTREFFYELEHAID